MYLDLAKEPFNFTPYEVAWKMTVPQIWALFLGGQKMSEPNQPQTPEEILEWANKRRAARGLPPAHYV